MQVIDGHTYSVDRYRYNIRISPKKHRITLQTSIRGVFTSLVLFLAIPELGLGSSPLLVLYRAGNSPGGALRSPLLHIPGR